MGNNTRHGNLFVAQKYCDISINAQIPGYWQHGFYVDPHYFPEDELKFSAENNLKLYIWNTQVEKDLINRNFFNYKIIGAPIIYLKTEFKNTNTKSKLLYVPAHNLKQEKIKFQWEPTLNYLAQLSQTGNEITMLLYYLDFDEFISNKKHKEFCDENNIKIDTLGFVHEVAFLSRLQSYYLNFDIIGSEILSTSLVYGAFLGLKVFVGGPIKYELLTTNAAYFKKYTNDIDSLEEYLRGLNDYYKNLHPSLFMHPNDASQQINMGKEFLGYNYKLSKKEMRSEFGWSLIFVALLKTYLKFKQIIKI